MANLTTAQKAELIVTDEYGTPVTGGLDIATGGSQIVAFVPQDGKMWAVALQPGEATVTVTVGASSGTLDLVVGASPLTITLGEPVAK